MEYRIPDGIRTIDKEWVKQHIDKNVIKVICPSSLWKIGEDAFKQYNNLEEIILNKGLMDIGKSAFEECKLKKITIPGTVKVIKYNTFNNCTSLEEIRINNGVERINAFAFGGNHSLTKKIIIPISINYISENAFGVRLKALEEITFKFASIPMIKGDVIIENKFLNMQLSIYGYGLDRIFGSNAKIIYGKIDDEIDYSLFSNIKKVNDEEKHKLGLELFNEINKDDIDLKKVQELLINGADTEIRDSNGNTGLMLMIKKGNNEAIKMYLLSKSDINVRNKFRETPLILASRSNNNDIAFELIKRNCIVNAMTVLDESALSIAYDNGNIELISKLENILNISNKEKELEEVQKVRKKILGGIKDGI